MGIEIERKFLVNKDAWSKIKANGILYRQGYLLREEGKSIRVRIVEGDKGYLTIKGKTNRFSRPEYEYPLPAQDAEELLQRFCSAVIEKKRYKITVNNKQWEVDEFLEDNEGLLVAELELSDENEAFQLPDWIEKEVTNDTRYYNSQLSVNPFKNWTL